MLLFLLRGFPPRFLLRLLCRAYPNRLAIWHCVHLSLGVQTSADDFNLDGVADALYLSVSMPLQADEQIYSASAYAFYDVRLHVRDL